MREEITYLFLRSVLFKYIKEPEDLVNTIAKDLAAQLVDDKFAKQAGYIECDGTDGAHPAFWRGQEDGVWGACMRIRQALEGGDGMRLGNPELRAVCKEVAKLKHRCDELENKVGRAQ